MRLSPSRFNRMLGEMGQQVLWRQATPCPCRTEYSGAAEIDCPNCHGRGTAWGPPIPAHTASAGMRTTRQYALQGQWQDGDVIWSIPSSSPMWSCGEHDRVTMIQASLPFSQVLTRDGNERLPFTVASIERCQWRRPGDRLLVETSLPKVDAATGLLSWPEPDTAPEPGAQFSLMGRRRPEFFVLNSIPRDRSHFGGLDLPKVVTARAFELFGR